MLQRKKCERSLRSSSRTLQQLAGAVPQPDFSWLLKAKVACVEVLTLSMSVEMQCVMQAPDKQVCFRCFILLQDPICVMMCYTIFSDKACTS